MIYVAVVGGASCSQEESELAYQVGLEIADRRGILLCGGGSGVMEAASKGAYERGAIVLGILPGDNNRSGNRYLTCAVATGMGEARNAIIARTADAMIAIGGEYGTLSEIALALKMSKPVITLGSWKVTPVRPLPEKAIKATDAREAVEKAFVMTQS